MASKKNLKVVRRGILAILIIRNAPEELVREYQGFCHDVSVHQRTTWMLLYDVSENDGELISRLLSDLAEVGFVVDSNGDNNVRR